MSKALSFTYYYRCAPYITLPVDGPRAGDGAYIATVPASCQLLAVGCWLLAVGCWLLAVGCWLLAVGWLTKANAPTPRRLVVHWQWFPLAQFVAGPRAGDGAYIATLPASCAVLWGAARSYETISPLQEGEEGELRGPSAYTPWHCSLQPSLHRGLRVLARRRMVFPSDQEPVRVHP